MRWLKKSAGDIKRFFCISPHCLVNYFLNGLIIIIPLAVTIWILAWFFNLIDGMLAPILRWGFGRSMPGLGFVIVIISIVLIGYFGIKVGHRRFFGFLESQVIKIPIVGTLYGGTKQILNGFTSHKSKSFLQVVFLEFPRKGIYSLGLVTNECEDRNGKKVLNVFIPTAPTPMGGYLQIVPESDVIYSSMSINDAMKLIISAGRVSHKDIADMLTQVPEPDGKEK